MVRCDSFPLERIMELVHWPESLPWGLVLVEEQD